MTRDVVFAFPGDLATPTGGYAYDRRIIAELKALGWRVDTLSLGDGFPRPSDQTLRAASELLRRVPAGRAIVIDGLAFGVMAQAAEMLRDRHPIIALVHHPLALETGLSALERDFFCRSERAALASARRVIVTSPATARLLAADYGVPHEAITVAPPGTDKVTPAHGSSDSVVHLLAVGTIVPRKGYDVLIAALAGLGDLPWRLTIAGACDRDIAAVARLDADIARFDLGTRVALVGALSTDALAALYAAVDLFVLPSRFEGYGMAFTEAIASGLPVVGTTAGAIPETVPAAAGVLVPPDDVDALASALRRLIERPEERRRLAAGARAAAGELPRWRDSAALFARAIEAVA